MTCRSVLCCMNCCCCCCVTVCCCCCCCCNCCCCCCGCCCCWDVCRFILDQRGNPSRLSSINRLLVVGVQRGTRTKPRLLPVGFLFLFPPRKRRNSPARRTHWATQQQRKQKIKGEGNRNSVDRDRILLLSTRDRLLCSTPGTR